MSYRKWVSSLLTLILAAAVTSSAAAQQRRAEVALEQAMHVEQVDGDLQRAITLYQRILADHSADRAVAAKAQLHIGLCYETLGVNEAQRAYQSVIQDYADQPDVVAQARAHLAALAPAAVASRGPVARMIFTSEDPADRVIQNPKVIIPSPDGRHLAYVQGRPGTEGVYLWDLETGTSERVTPAQEGLEYWSAAWAADGKRIAYKETDRDTDVGTIRILDLVSRRSETVPRLDARALNVVDWSRDGRYLLCARNQKNTLELVTVADGSVTTLSDSVWAAQRASISPDGRYVAYGAGPHTHETLYVQPLAGGPRIGIAESGGEMYLHPLWSPDGSAIAYQENDGIWVQPMKDGAASGPARLAYRTDAPRWVTSWTEAGGLYFMSMNEVHIPMEVEVDPRTVQAVGSGPRDLEGLGDNVWTFTWSPDRRSVVINEWWQALTVQSTETGVKRSFDHLAPEGEMILGGTWSHDGTEIMYETGTPLSRSGRTVKALNVSSGRVRDLFPPLAGSGSMFSLSDDGHMMAYVRRESDKTVSVLVTPIGEVGAETVAKINLPGQDPINQAVLPRISPDGNWVYFALQQGRRSGGQFASDAGSIWVVSVDGGDARKVTTAPHIVSAQWDPTGRYIAYTSEGVDDATVIRVVEVATGKVHQIRIEKTSARIGITDWSRDGRYIGLVRLKNWWEYWAVQGLLDRGPQ